MQKNDLASLSLAVRMVQITVQIFTEGDHFMKTEKTSLLSLSVLQDVCS